ncbi:MAG: hypothetical protein ACRC46_02990 [Thermoguttaceae bacterium]
MRLTIGMITLLTVVVGCQGPVMTGGYPHGVPYRGYGVDGPGPGVIPQGYQQMSLDGSGAGQMGAPQMAPQMGVAAEEMMMPYVMPTSQLYFGGPEGMQIRWDVVRRGAFDSAPCVVPATHDFMQGAIYRLKLSNIPGRYGKELYPTLEVAPTMARTQAYLAHNSVPIEFSDNDFDQVLSGNFITKVVYLPNPEYQGLAMAGVGTLVNTQLEPGVDPVVEASRRGAILAIIRMGNKDLSRASQAEMMMGTGAGMPPMMNGGMTGSSIPQNAISGVNIPAYGTPMTKTTTGRPGPPQLPQGAVATNRYPVMRAEPIPAPPSVGTAVIQPNNVPRGTMVQLDHPQGVEQRVENVSRAARPEPAERQPYHMLMNVQEARMSRMTPPVPTQQQP